MDNKSWRHLEARESRPHELPKRTQPQLATGHSLPATVWFNINAKEIKK